MSVQVSAVLTFLVDKSMSELKRVDRKRFSESVFKSLSCECFVAVQF